MSVQLDAFCGSAFWDYGAIWNTTNPDFTECFQKTVLIWMPCAFLWICAPFVEIFAQRSRNSDIPWTILNLTKLVSVVILALLALIDIAYNVYRYSQGETLPKVNFYAPIIQLITFVLATRLLVLERKKGIQSSGILFVFWFLLMISGVVRYRSLLMRTFDLESQLDEFDFVVYMIYYPFVVTLFVLSCLADSPSRYKEVDDDAVNPCPAENCSFLSKLLFTWFDSIAWFGYRNPLERKNLWSLIHQHKSKYVVPWFEKNWFREVHRNGGFKIPLVQKSRSNASFSAQKQEVDIITPAKELDATFRQPSLAKALFKTFGANFFCGGCLKFISDILLFINPMLLDLLIRFVSNGEPLWKGYLYAVLMLLVAIFQSLLMGQYFYKMFILGLQVRTALIAAIYKKALVLSNSARKSSTVGEIVNLMSVDAQQIMDLAPYLHVTWSSPLQIALALYFLWNTLGPSVLAGLAVMVLLIPFSALIAKVLEKLQLKQMNTKDNRVKMMNELLNGIKVLKLYAWEPSFEKQVLNIRTKELGYLKKAAYAVAGSSFLWMCAPFMVTLASFATFILIDEHNILDASKAFVSLAIFQIISIPMGFLPMMVVFLIQASVSVGRLNNFLCNDEQKLDNVTHENFEADPIVVENASFSWGLGEEATLANINMHVEEGSLVAVVGPVGCGKSSLISALVGDMDKLLGKVNTKGLIAYVPQQAWIQNVTLKDNILFGKPYNNKMFNKCIEACALKADLDMLPGGELTEIGERGINLSGGQKQRVSLARSVYNDADIYLLDDPLSAVDAHVGRHIFDNVIGPNGILKEKTRILVTHGITYLPQMDCIVVLNKGAISEVGTYKELLLKKGAFADFLLNYLQNENDQADDVEDLEKIKEEILANIGSPDLQQRLKRQFSVPRSHASEDASSADGMSLQRVARSLSVDSTIARQTSKEDGCIKHASDDKAMTELITQETVETGEVQSAVYLYYFKAVGTLLSFTILLFDILSYTVIVGSNLWLSAWSNDQPTVNGTQDIALRDLRLGVYGGLGFAQAIFVFFSALILAFGSIRAGNLLHSDMLSNIMRAPMSFFDTTPLGRIVNRFSKDVDVVDQSIPETMNQFLMCALQVVSTIVVISISTPIFIAVIIPLSIIYYFIQRLYISTSRQLKRLESTYRSPIYSHFSETVTGSSTIRAYGKQLDFILQSEKRVDENQIAYFPSIVANRWLAIRLEFLGSLIVFSAALFVVLARDTISAGIVGLSLSYALSLTENLNWMVRMSGELETNIVAVERMKEYALTPTEKALKIEETKPPTGWPQSGCISFRNYALRYREGLELVLKGITCDISAGEKIGIVGRTGAGKSSLTLALLRIIEPTAGSIIIDGIDIATIGLHDLRKGLTIIPQDPVLFSGTLRINLDPFTEHTDEGIWKALELSHLKTFVTSLPLGLLYEVAEGGENLSVGQRQLVCLARALLRKSKILILDEATAAVDLETDDLIQDTIRKEFADCTVLTIAHRLNTIMDSTKVVVLDKGLISEFDSPENLLQNSSSVFFGMAKEAGLV